MTPSLMAPQAPTSKMHPAASNAFRAPACLAPSATPPACVASPPVPTRLCFNASARAPPPFGDRRSSLTAVARTRARSEP